MLASRGHVEPESKEPSILAVKSFPYKPHPTVENHAATVYHIVAGSFQSATWRKRATTWKTSPLSSPWSPNLAMRNPVTHGHLRSGSTVQTCSNAITHIFCICSMVTEGLVYNHTHIHILYIYVYSYGGFHK